MPVLMRQVLESGAWSAVGTVGRQMLDLFFAFQAVYGEGPDIQCRPAVGPPSWVGRGRAGEEGWVEGSYQGPRWERQQARGPEPAGRGGGSLPLVAYPCPPTVPPEGWGKGRCEQGFQSWGWE